MGGGKMLRDRYRIAARHDSRFTNFTNFGILDPTCGAFEQVSIKKAYGVGPIQYAPGILIAVSTYCNTLHLVFQGNGDEQFHGFIHNFLEDILSRFRCLP
jgi:NRPS condensation-like uncharacterized protein